MRCYLLLAAYTATKGVAVQYRAVGGRGGADRSANDQGCVSIKSQHRWDNQSCPPGQGALGCVFVPHQLVNSLPSRRRRMTSCVDPPACAQDRSRAPPVPVLLRGCYPRLLRNGCLKGPVVVVVGGVCGALGQTGVWHRTSDKAYSGKACGASVSGSARRTAQTQQIIQGKSRCGDGTAGTVRAASCMCM
jgi:hypothetical protein